MEDKEVEVYEPLEQIVYIDKELNEKKEKIKVIKHKLIKKIWRGSRTKNRLESALLKEEDA